MKALSTNYKPVFIELKNLLSFAIFLFFFKVSDTNERTDGKYFEVNFLQN